MNKYQEYEKRKQELKGLTPEEYEEAIKEICEELGI